MLIALLSSGLAGDAGDWQACPTFIPTSNQFTPALFLWTPALPARQNEQRTWPRKGGIDQPQSLSLPILGAKFVSVEQ
jgi:hypothetical protein